MKIKKVIKDVMHLIGLDVKKYTPMPLPLDFVKSLGIKTVLDIGANVGQFATEMRRNSKEVSIISFEPLPHCFEKLTTNLKSDSNFKAINIALGDTSGEMMMHQNEYTPSSSLLELNEDHIKTFPNATKTSEVMIKIETLDDLMKNLNVEKEILIKMDVQGYEHKVIAGGIETVKSAKAIIVEISFLDFYRGQPNFNDIYNMLYPLGFKYHGSIQRKIDRKTGLTLSEDSVFIR